MAPFPLCYLFSTCETDFRATLVPRISAAESQLRAQWHSPSDILSLLLILGPDVVQRALAQLVGTRYVPVGFSFGWVAYSINALLAIAGDGQLMPDADVQALIVNAQSGHHRENRAWIIGRLLRDFEKRASPFAASKDSPNWEALRVSIFRWDQNKEQGKPIRDWVWFSGLAVIVVQIAIAIIPLALLSEWATLVLVTGGLLLASAQAALPQWASEKWACPTNGKSVSITRGNGHRHVMVILGCQNALDLEILASRSSAKAQSIWSKAAVAVLATLWTVLLITVAGLKQGSWYLLAIGAIGMIQNIVVAASPRSSSAFGLHLSCIHTIKAGHISKVLMITEQYYPGVGVSLIPVFHPAGFIAPEDEANFWHRANFEKSK